MIARLTLKLMQHYSTALLQNQHYGKNAQDIIILLGVAVGTHENKPMTAAKLSEFICIPRPTIVRRVAGLVDDGLLRLDERKLIYLSDIADKRASKAAPILNKTAILRTATFLSKLDNKPIAS
jgi:CRP-like cAMP-binding protein